jgi:hypothetical protein
MSSGRPPTRPVAPEDDWFVGTGTGRSPSDETELREARQRPSIPGDEEQRPAALAREGEASRKRIVPAVAGAVILLLAGVLTGALASRALTGVDTTTSLLPTTATLTTTLTTTAAESTTNTTSTTTPTTPTTPQEGVTLRRGATGEEVRQLQEMLVALGYSSSVDGKYGPATAQAVQSFQTSSGLTADGVAGPATLAALSAAVNGT